MPSPGIDLRAAFEQRMGRDTPGGGQQLGGGNGDPLAGIDPELLQQINIIAAEFGISAETALAILTARQGGPLTERDASDILLGIDPSVTTGGASNALGFAQLAETQRQNAFDRVTDKIRLLSATDDLQESRRENVMFAMLEAAPLMVNPGTEFQPGFEPGGAATRLSDLLGFDFEPQRLPTFELPLNELLDAPTTVTPDLIEQQRGALG